MRKITCFPLFILIFLPLCSLGQIEFVDPDMVYKIKQEGMENSDIDELAFWMIDYSGPRLTASTGVDHAAEWAKRKLEEYGLQNVRIEIARAWDRGGWDNTKTYAAMTAPYYVNFTANPVAWTGSTEGVVKSEVILLDIKDESDFDRYKGKLKNKIILIPYNATEEASFILMTSRNRTASYSDQELKELSQAVPPSREIVIESDTLIAALSGKIAEFVKRERAAVIINESKTPLFNVPFSSGYSYKSGDAEPIPELNLPMEAFGRMERLVQHNIPVEMEIEIKNTFTRNPYVYNVIGEIPGTDPVLKDEIVLIGAHLDSWHGGTGATDNAAGCIVMMEAMRILKVLGINPERTIRIALWEGEEQGFYGSRGYVEKYLVDPQTHAHKPDYDKFDVYFNMDNSTGKFRGIYTQGNELVRPIFEAWLKPFADMECTTVSIRNYGNTDHIAFDEVNLPGFSFIQDRTGNNHCHHTIMDTYERLILPDLKQNAVIVASMAYHAAMRDRKIPGKPVHNPPSEAR